MSRMRNKAKTNDKLMIELKELHLRIAELEKPKTGLKRTEKELRESEAFNFALFQHNPVETIAVDREGRVTKTNIALREERDRVPNIRDIMYKDYARKHEIDMRAELMKCIRSGKEKRFPELKYGNKFLSIIIAPFPHGAIITSQDITERKKVEEELQRSQEFLECIYNGVDSPIFVIDVTEDGDFVFSGNNIVHQQAMNLSPEEFKGKKPEDLLPHISPELASEIRANYQRCVDMGRTIEYDEMVVVNGKEIWVFTRLIPLRNVEGRTYRIIGISTDITELKQAEEAFKKAHVQLERRVKERTADLTTVNEAMQREITERKKTENALLESEEKYRLITESSVDTIFQLDLKGKITFINKAGANMFGYKSKELLGLDLGSLMSKTKLSEGEEIAGQMFSGHDVKGELIMKHKKGYEFPIQFSAVPIKKEGEIIGFTGVSRDISKRKQAEKELRLAKESAEIANLAKSDFLASMSHELRTPLNAIIGFSEVMRDQYFGKLNEKQSEYINDILDSGKHLLTLVNDVLDLSQVELGKSKLELSLVDVKEFLRNSLIVIKEKCLEHGISLDLHIPQELTGVKITVDERKLKQVMFNLLSNAVKFSHDGGLIEVGARQQRKELVISISDTGIGISPKYQERIFEGFFQIEDSLHEKIPGTGLGLSLSKRLVETHGGRIWMESKGEGKGSRFCFTVPLKSMDLKQ